MKKLLDIIIKFNFFKKIIYICFTHINFFLEKVLDKINKFENKKINDNFNITELKKRTFDFISSLRVLNKNNFLIGYLHSKSCTKVNLYSLISVVLIKSLFNKKDNFLRQELKKILSYQDEDGLFRDEVLNCKEANIGDDWGWRHLTLHALMALDLYGIKSKYPVNFAYNLDVKKLAKKLNSYDWKKRLPWTSNAVQNLAVFLQYNKKYHKQNNASLLINEIIDFINKKQSKKTGLFFDYHNNFQDLSDDVQSAYHFFLIHFSENKKINFINKIIDNVLRTQNIIGGYGFYLNSSACEDIDSIDILLRLSLITNYKKKEIKKSFRKFLNSSLVNFNEDGGWVFRRNESLKIIHSQMISRKGESNLFYTWFRLLSFSYASIYSEEKKFRFNFNLLKNKIGHQFLNTL
jgi:hypothetical protein